MNQRFSRKIYHANVNLSLMEENIIQIRGKITVNVSANVKNIIYMKKIIFGIMLHAVAKMVDI